MSFDKDILKYCQSIIDDELSESYYNFDAMRKPLEVDSRSTAKFMVSTLQFPKIQLQFANGKDWASMATFTVKEIRAKFHFYKVAVGRAIEIVSISRCEDTNLGELVETWTGLVVRYQNMPFAQFSGANKW